MSPLIEYDLCLLDNLKKIYTKMLQDVPMEKKVYAKFHPAQGIIGQNIFVEAIKKKGIKCEIMSNEINIETVIMTSKNIELWGVDSSVLFYAPILNPTAKIKYFNEELAAIDVRYKQYKHHCLSV